MFEGMTILSFFLCMNKRENFKYLHLKSSTKILASVSHHIDKLWMLFPVQNTVKWVWHLPPLWYFHFTPYQKWALAIFSTTPFCLWKYFSWKGVHRTYKLYYAMLKIIKMIMLYNNVLCNTMHSLFSCKCKYLLFSSFE